METHATVGPIGPLAAGGQRRAAVGGAIVILVLASGSALCFGAIVERLTTTSDTTARASIVGALEFQKIPSVRRVVDCGPDAPGAITDSSLANMFDGWSRRQSTPGPSHGLCLRHDGAPNELRILGK
jgi:hypothetical protein